ncbi:MAG: hypothetical protein WCK41_07955 [Actinomycetes bacterium]
MLYPLSYEGGRWRKGGAKPLVVMAMAQRSGVSRLGLVVATLIAYLERAVTGDGTR